MSDRPNPGELQDPKDLETYSDRLRFAMNLRDPAWQQTELARVIGCEKAAINGVLNRSSNTLNVVNSARAARALSVDHYWLATGEGTPNFVSGLAPVSPRAIYITARLDALQSDKLREATYAVIVQILALASANSDKKSS